jgi:hypothetical protein
LKRNVLWCHLLGERANSLESDNVNKNTMLEYLLGELPQEEVTRVEEMMLASEEYFERLTSVEHELVDSYVRNELQGKERRQFEKAYLNTQRRRDRVKLSRALLLAAGPSRPGVPLFRRTSALLIPLQPLRYLPAVAAVLLVSSVIWLAMETSGLRRQIADMQGRFGSPHSREQRALSQLAEELARERELRGRLEQRVNESLHVSRPIASFLLLPGMVRGDEPGTRLLIPPDASAVRLQLAFVSGEEYRAYVVALVSPGGEEVWSEEIPKAQRLASGTVVVVQLPASLLATGDYVVRLSGVTNAAKIEALESYPFSIRKR